MKNIALFSLTLAMLVGYFVNSTQASITTIHHAPANEETVPQIIDLLYSAYGGHFTAYGNDFSNGLVTVTRVQDSLTTTGSPIQLASFNINNKTDQIWQGGIFSAIAYVRHTSNQNLRFGYVDGQTGGTFHSLLSVTGKNGFQHPSSTTTSPLNNLTGHDFRFAISPTLTSRPGTNGVDNMVTYLVSGYNHEVTPRWLLLFEDGSDRDFNDLAVEVVQGPPRSLAVVPEPMTAIIWMGLSASSLGWVALKRRKQA